MPFAQLNDVRLHYRLDGDATAPVLALSNSLGTDLEMWEPQIPALLREFRVLRYDTRGHGQSEVTAGSYSIAMLAADVVALLDHLALKSVHFCGLSMGGMTGMWLGANVPDRVQRLVLSNTSAHVPPADAWNNRIALVKAGGMTAIADTVMTRWFTAGFAAQKPSTVTAMKSMLERTPADGYVACCAAVRDMDQREEVAAIAAQTLVIAGAHDVATPPADGRYLAERIPAAQLVMLDAGHLSNIEAAAAYTDGVLSFLTS